MSSPSTRIDSTPALALRERLHLQTPSSMSKSSRIHHVRTQSSPSSPSPSIDRPVFDKSALNFPMAGVLTPPITPVTARTARSSSIASSLSPLSPVDERIGFFRKSRASLDTPSTPVNPHEQEWENIPGKRRVRASWSEDNITSAFDSLVTPLLTIPREPSWEEVRDPRPFTQEYHLEGTPQRGYSEFGHGAWSTVYKATISVTPARPAQIWLPSPPASPQLSGPDKVVAVKAPARHDATPILRDEACILTYLHASPRAAKHIVPFCGFDTRNHTLVLDAIPLTLANFSRNAAKTAAINFSTKNMFDPVVGMRVWLHLAEQLVDGLAFLHDKDIVHGDIKPMNVLLRPRHVIQADPISTSSTPDDLLFDALYCDFSSAQHFPASADPSSIEQVSAVTTEYTAPELLASFYSTSSPPARAVATRASDVFALAVTLLYAVTGESPYSAARIEIQKVSFAREGRPLDFVRAGQQASRVMRGDVVERVLCGEKARPGALSRAADERWDAPAWAEVVRSVGTEWCEKKGRR